MELPDSFITIQTDSNIEFKVKGSKFIGQARNCDNESDAEEILSSIRKKYYDATHNCFAYQVGPGRKIKFRYSDDGEPSGTAGKPIYNRIKGKNLINLIIVVTRYFGGTKLGTGGLTHAYSEAAGLAIEKAGIIEKLITREIPVTVRFQDYNNVERIIRKMNGRITSSDFTDKVNLIIEIRLSLINVLKEHLVELTAGRIDFE